MGKTDNFLLFKMSRNQKLTHSFTYQTYLEEKNATENEEAQPASLNISKHIHERLLVDFVLSACWIFAFIVVSQGKWTWYSQTLKVVGKLQTVVAAVTSPNKKAETRSQLVK